MSEFPSTTAAAGPIPTKDVRPAREPVTTDEVDRRILTVLARDARTPNNAVAAEVGVAPSTCLARMRALRDSGVIRGYHADLDPAALGRPLQALVSVRLSSGARGRLRSFTDRIRARPEVRSVYFLAGGDDFLLDVTAVDVADLRDFVVEELSAYPEVASTETNLVFEHVRGTAAGL
ncbi:Lrp/AsnC family transcriptional regulator [Nakamurella flavida]|uniref:Lrp/AsnC family transcriptional regulator n=1 Tax=Nakamurella flavida TaxID=363630 RepID=A0A939C7L5_9ACTN|nr:Lrp/AsnC family transcriptional regulator [Nakamurella flavida]MBM9478292.1 Lrp/AsnC family transcriptional regulator [Nakamurella flavida]MDP9777537.1 DNA-binding Lrp family transcriptional regulator [Nakamurella flavida]